MAELGGNPSDYWWLKPTQPDNPLPAMELGRRIKQDAINNFFEMQKLKLAEKAQGDNALTQFERNQILSEQAAIRNRETLAKTQLQNQLMEGSAKLAAIGAGVTDWADPSVRTKLLEFATQYPAIAGTDIYKSMSGMHKMATDAKRQLELYRQRDLSIELRQKEYDESVRRNDLTEKKLETDLSPIDKIRLTDELTALKERVKSGEFKDPEIKDESAQKKAESMAVQIERSKIFNKFRKKPEQVVPAEATTIQPSGKVKMIAPDGRTGFVPESQKNAALGQGYKLVE